MTILEIEAIESLDFEANLACESMLECDRPIAWRLVLSCCAKVFLLCDPCKVEILQEIAANPDQTMECRFCRNHTPYGKLVMSVEAL